MHIGKEFMMSDTKMERKSNRDFIRAARGKVVIGGLGIGMLLHNILDKSEVDSVLVIENNKDVIDLVAPRFAHPKLTVVHGDVFTYETKEKFDSIYFDIWATISEDNLDDIRKLHAKWKFRKTKGGGSFMTSWLMKYLQEERRKSRRDFW